MAMTFLFKTKKYIRELQRADDQKKKLWLISASTISMILIILLWAVYFHSSLKSANQNEEITATDNQQENFWQIINNGIKIMSDTFNQKISDLKTMIHKNFESLKMKAKKTNDFSIKNEDAIKPPISNFTPLPKTPLP